MIEPCITVSVTAIERLIAMADGREPRDDALLNELAVEAAETRRIGATIQPVRVEVMKLGRISSPAGRRHGSN